jgi:hypothetical protein
VKSQRGTATGETLNRLAAEIAEDRAALLEIMAGVGVPVRTCQVPRRMGGGKAGGLKLNGHVLHRSPLSGLVELEALRLGVQGKAVA